MFKRKVEIIIMVVSLLYLPSSYAVGESNESQVSTEANYTKEDTVINEIIKKNLSNDPRITSPNVDVKTIEGVVSLIGNFNSADEAGAAIEDIAATPGVSDIDVSQVVLSTGIDPTFSDIVITSRIKGLYSREKPFGANPINIISVETKEGVVFLIGAVDDIAQRQAAIDLAAQVPNVIKVIPKIAIKFPK